MTWHSVPAIALKKRGDYEAAIASVRAELERAQALSRMADLQRMHLNDPESARQTLEEISREFSDSPAGHLARQRLALLYAEALGEPDKTTAQLERLLSQEGILARWYQMLADLQVEGAGRRHRRARHPGANAGPQARPLRAEDRIEAEGSPCRLSVNLTRRFPHPRWNVPCLTQRPRRAQRKRESQRILNPDPHQKRSASDRGMAVDTVQIARLPSDKP